MPRKARKTVKDIISINDIGEMLLSFFAVMGVLSSPTLVPNAVKGAGLWLVAISMVVIYLSIYTIIRVKGHEGDAAVESAYHLVSAVIVTSIGAFIAGMLYGYVWGKSIDEMINSPLTVAFSVGLLWAGVIDGLKGD